MIPFEKVSGFFQKCLLEANASNHFKLIGIAIRQEAADPLHAYTQGTADYFFIEQPSRRKALLALGKTLPFTASGEARFDKLHAQVEALQAHYRGAMLVGGSERLIAKAFPLHYFGSFTFEAAPTAPYSVPPGLIFIPECLFIQKGKVRTIVLYCQVHAGETLGSLQHTWQKRCNYLKPRDRLQNNSASRLIPFQNTNDLFSNPSPGPDATIQNGLKAIQAGICQKIVIAHEYTRSFSAPRKITPAQHLDRLRKCYPTCNIFAIGQPEQFCFLGATPETLFEIKKGLLRTEALGGSTTRGRTSTEDRQLSRQLLKATAYRKEHAFIVRHITQRLAAYKLAYQVGPCRCLKLPYIQHLRTPLTAKLPAKGIAPLKLLKSLFPTPAVCGHPQKQALQAISQIENFQRGLYTGTIGWSNTANEAQWLVCIRTALILKHQIRFQAGVGLTSASNQAAEVAEIHQKLSALSALL